MDCFGIARPKLCTLIAEIVKFSEAHHEARHVGQRGLFDGDSAAAQAAQDLSWTLSDIEKRPGAPDPEWLKKEKSLLGVFLSGHPLQFHREDKKAFSRCNTADLVKVVGKRVSMLAVLAAVNERITKNNKRMASIRLEDEDGAIEAVMFQAEIPAEFPELGTVVVASGQVGMSFDGASVRFKLDKITAVEDMRTEHVKSATLCIIPTGGKGAQPAQYQAAVDGLKQHLDAHQGDTPMKLVVRLDDAELTISLGEQEIELRDSFIHGLGKLAFASAELRFQLYS